MTVEEIQEAIEAMERILFIVPKSRVANVLGCANVIFLVLEKAKREALAAAALGKRGRK